MPRGSSSLSSGEELLEASRDGDLVTVQELLDEGIDVNWEDENGYNALSSACVDGHVEVVKLLLDSGAQVDTQDRDYGDDHGGWTPLMFACFHGHIDCARLLLERGADMSITCYQGKTVKEMAVRYGLDDFVDLLDEVCMIQTQNKDFKYRLDCSNFSVLYTKFRGKKKSNSQAQALPEFVLEPLNKALEENGRLKAEVGILKEREICKQELMNEYKAKVKKVEKEIRRVKDDNQQLKEEVLSLKERDISMRVENECLKRREEELRLELNTERTMFQTTISSLMNGLEDRKRKRNDEDDDLVQQSK
jgi:hypothetical protein